MLSNSAKSYLTFLLLFACIADVAQAQSTESDLRVRLKGKQLYLRGFWGDPQLRFNKNGELAVPSNPLSFTVAGFTMKYVKLTKSGLTIRGNRLGLQFNKTSRRWVEVEELEIDIATPENGDFTQALDLIFTDDLSSLVPSMPNYWQRYARCELFPPASDAALPAFCNPKRSSASDATKAGDVPSPPKIKVQVPAAYSRFARGIGYSGSAVVAAIVDTEGRSGFIRVVSPAGLGLDEQALAAVQKWQFIPAKLNGEPIRSEIEVQVNFHAN